MTGIAATPSQAHRLPIWARLAAIPVTGASLLLGLWLFAGQLAPGRTTGSIIVAVLWFVVAYLGLRVVKKRWPELDVPVTATFAVLGMAVAFWFAWNTFRDVTVNEQIAVGIAASETASGPSADVGSGEDSSATDGVPPAEATAATGTNVEVARGEFTSLAHGSSGTAAVVELAEGDRVLTFSELDTDNGPDLRVYLVEGPINDNGDGGDFVDLGALKGNKGNQQYAVPDGVDVSRFDTVVIWCRAFSVGFGAATLLAS